MDTKQRVALYTRVSSQEQAVEGVSLEAQLAALHGYAQGQGWEIVDEYIDGGYSGGTDETRTKTSPHRCQPAPVQHHRGEQVRPFLP